MLHICRVGLTASQFAPQVEQPPANFESTPTPYIESVPTPTIT